MQNSNNKQELILFLSNKVATMNCLEEKEIVITSGTAAIFHGSERSMTPCNHEEADTRLVIHL